MSKATEELEAREHARDMLRRYLDPDEHNGPDAAEDVTIYTLTDGNKVRAFVVDDGSIEEISYYAAKVGGKRITPGRWIITTGGGYNRGQEVASDCRMAIGQGHGAGAWSEL